MALGELLKKKSVQIIVVVLVTFAAYSNIFSNSFVFDDHRLIIDWSIHKSFKNIPQLFDGKSEINSLTWNYRPLRGIFFIGAYQLFGEKPWGYHLVSVLVHIGVTILVYLITYSLISSYSLKTNGRISINSRMKANVKRMDANIQSHAVLSAREADAGLERMGHLLPFVTALLFGLHPIHTEAITFITASFDTIGAVFFFAAFYFFIKASSKLPKYSWSYLFALIFTLSAVFTYEIMIVLPMVLVLYDVVIRKVRVRRNWLFIKRYTPFFLVVLFYLFVRMILVQIVGRGEYLGGSFYLTMLTMIKAVMKYIELLIFPLNLSLNQTVSYGIKAHLDSMTNLDNLLHQSIFNWQILLSITFFIFLIVVAMKSFKKHSVISFGIFWFFICILPFIYLVPQGPIMQERYIYIASFGFVLILSYLGYLSYLRYGRLILVILMVIFLAYGVRTFVRNLDWKGEEILWQHQARGFDDDVQANFLAGTFLESSEPDQSIYYYQRALNVDPNLPIVYLNLGKIYLAKGERDSAISQFRQVLILDRNLFDAVISLNKLGLKASDIGLSDIVDWQEYKYQNSLSFYYPGDWKVSSLKGGGINVADEDFKVEMMIEKWQGKLEEYLNSQTETYGQLVNQGLAQVPNFEQAWVRVWFVSSTPEVTGQSTSGVATDVTKLQFFLFKEEKVIKVLVYPADSQEMKIFEKILGTIRISN